jgi:hypothetical protein
MFFNMECYIAYFSTCFIYIAVVAVSVVGDVAVDVVVAFVVSVVVDVVAVAVC